MEWKIVDDINNLELEENKPYLICVENWNGNFSEWHPIIAYWYIEGSELTLREEDNTPHHHNIDKTGFYVVNDCGDDRYDKIYQINYVKYYTDIQMPNSNPDDMLDIEK